MKIFDETKSKINDQIFNLDEHFINEFQKKLSEQNKDYEIEINSISFQKMKVLFESAIIALKKEKDKDYIISNDKNTNKKQIEIIELGTGRIKHGSRWSNCIHEFVEIKEGIYPSKQSNTIASISHPSFFKNYKTIFGLTGTIGDIYERSEITEIYNIDSFEVPSNFQIKRKKFDPIITTNSHQKLEIIANIIKESEDEKSEYPQTILVLLLTIKETIELSNILNKNRNEYDTRNYYILNDIQNESEEYLVLQAGKYKNVLISTNAAARGTDIILTDETIEKGGLFVIIGFMPENSRIEFQGIGRAARQGQPGSYQIVISKDEKFFGNYKFNNYEEAVEYRNNKVQQVSQHRIICTKYEKKLFKLMRFFFWDQIFLDKYFKKEDFKLILKNEKLNVSNLNSFADFIVEKHRNDWAEFFSDYSNNRKLENLDDFDSQKIYEKFKSEYNWNKICTFIHNKDDIIDFVKIIQNEMEKNEANINDEN